LLGVKPLVENGRIADLDDSNRRCAFLAAALSSIPDQVYAFDRNRKLTYANAATIELFAKSEAGVIGKGLEQLGFPPDVAGKLNAGIDGVFSTGREVRDEIFLAVGTGPGNYYRYVWGPICNEDGVVELVIGVSHTTTERRRLEDRLSESESRFRAVTELAPALLWETDPPGSHVVLNARWLEYTGQSHAQTQQFGWLDAIRTTARLAKPSSVARIAAAGRSKYSIVFGGLMGRIGGFTFGRFQSLMKMQRCCDGLERQPIFRNSASIWTRWNVAWKAGRASATSCVVGWSPPMNPSAATSPANSTTGWGNK
jgi:PAS domain S-box-containing protein